jgi:hypothetical protein
MLRRQSAWLQSSLLAPLLILRRAGFWLIDYDAIIEVMIPGRDLFAAGILIRLE